MPGKSDIKKAIFYFILFLGIAFIFLKIPEKAKEKEKIFSNATESTSIKKDNNHYLGKR